jgi:hypothetical protein
MSKAHFIVPTGATEDVMTVRLGSAIATNGVIGTGGSMNPEIDQNKFVKLAGESRYDLAAAGDAIEAYTSSIEQALSGGYSIGGIVREGAIYVVADGLQATAGTGTLAVGDYVVVGTVAAIGTANTLGYPKVCKATQQPGAVPADLTAAGLQARNAAYPWRVESLGTVGTGAVGTIIVISRTGS